MSSSTHCQAKQYSDQMYCSVCQLTWDTNDSEPPNCLLPPKIKNNPRYVIEPKPSKPLNEIALIGFLAAKLAVYEPDSDTVKQALEYLKCRT